MKEEDFVNDKFLQDALFRLETNYFEKRKRLETIFDYEQYKNITQKIKQNNIDKIQSNTQELIENLRKKNIDVVLANNAHEACLSVLEILKKHDIKNVVKSKSLTTEEIHLNEFLKQNGIDAFETDLGEWLVQIANQPSSHMTAPAIHMSKEKICALLNETFNTNLSTNLSELVEFSKNKIREYFNLKQCAGICGSNAVTKDGIFFIVSNEGNVQNVLLSDLNICIVGIDKIVSDIEEALTIVDFLPKAATAQLSTSYVDCFEKPFGKFYVILLDNGRLKLSTTPYRQILQCIRCGACQNACCVYTTVSGLFFRGDVYAGPIGVLLSYANSYKDIGNFANLCLGCMACDSICSTKIPIQSLILKIKSEYPQNSFIKDKILNSLSNYTLVRQTTSILSLFFKKQMKLGVKSLDEYFGFDFRLLPKPNKKSFDLLKTKDAPIGLFAGCSINIFYENIGNDCLNVAKKLNIDISVIKQPSCCGAACYYNGKKTQAAISAQKIQNTIERYKQVIFLDPHCEHMVERDYFEIANIKLQTKLIDASSYFLEKINTSHIKPLGKKLTYHHPCHLLRGLKTSMLLESFLKENEPQFIELNESDKCCGFAGSYSIMHKGISKKLVERKVQNILNTQAEVVITACPGCIMQIDGYLKNAHIDIKVMHFVSYLNTILGG